VACFDGKRSDNLEACTCPDANVCETGCLLPQTELPDPIDATLQLLNRMFVTTTALGTCSQPAAAMSSADLVYYCLDRCQATEQCVAFDIQTQAGTCCLYSAYSSASTFVVPGAAFYVMPQCGTCIDTHFKDGRSCEPFAVPPVVQDGTAKRVLDIPFSTPVGTTLLELRASPEASFAPLTFSLEGPSSTLAVGQTGQTGQLKLQAALVTAGTISVTVQVQDSRDSCTVEGPNGQPQTTIGGCVTTVNIDIRVAVFLSCPTSIVTFVPLGEAAAEVAWAKPTLPGYLGDLTVTTDLADTTSTASPYLYSVGTRRITYLTEELSIGGSIQCAFDVTVLPGYPIEIASIGRKAAPSQVQEFLVVEVAETSDGARLPSVIGDASAGGLSLGLMPAQEAPFTVTPTVRGAATKMPRFMQMQMDKWTSESRSIFPHPLPISCHFFSPSRPPG
jgi:hypothetical protein